MFDHFNHLFAGELFRQKFYLDPGSSSFLIQLLLASLLGGLVLIRASWRKIKMFFAKLFNKDIEVDEEESPSDPTE